MISKLDALITEISLEFPDFKIMKKSESAFMKFVNALLLICTFGRMDEFMLSYTSMVNDVVYTSERWEVMDDTAKMVALRHERVHMRQAKKYGRFWYAILYLFLPFPLLFARWRTRFEMEAYEESMRALHELGGDIRTLSYRTWMIDHFTTAEYGWMCRDVDAVTRWYETLSSSIVRGV